LIFENTPRSDDQMDQLLSNPMPASILATDLPSIRCDQLDQLELATDPQLIQAPPLQGEDLRATDPSDPLFATSKKFPNDEDVKKDNFEVFWQTCWGRLL